MNKRIQILRFFQTILRAKNSSFLGIICILFTALGIRLFYIPRAIVGWDEGVYLRAIFDMSQAFSNKDIPQIWYLSFVQYNHAFFQAWILGFLLSFLHFSITQARTIGLIWFVLTGFFTFKMARKSVTQHKQIVGVLAMFFVITSPLVLFLSTVALKEMMGTALTLMISYIYLSNSQTKPLRLVTTSIGLIALTMTKTNFGILLFGIICINELVSFIMEKHLIKSILRIFLLLLPYFGYMAWWITHPYNRIDWLIVNLTNPFPLTNGFTQLWQYIVYYPLSILYIYSPSLITGTLVVSSLFLGWRYFHNRIIRFCWIAILTNIALGIHHYNLMMDRFIVTTMPFLFVITSVVWTNILTSSINIFPKFKPFIFGCTGILCLWIVKDIFTLPFYVEKIASYTNKSPMFNQRDYKDQWVLPNQIIFPTMVPRGTHYQTPEEVFRFIAQSIDLSKPYKIIGEANEFSPAYRDLILQLFSRDRISPVLPYDSFVAGIEILPDSPYYTQDYLVMNKWKFDAFNTFTHDSNYFLLKEKTFNDLGVTVWIFAMRNNE